MLALGGKKDFFPPYFFVLLSCILMGIISKCGNMLSFYRLVTFCKLICDMLFQKTKEGSESR